MSTPSRRRRNPSGWLTPAALWAFSTAVAAGTTRSAYAAGDLVAVAALYAGLAVALTAAVRLLGSLGTSARLGGVGLVGVVSAWHLREQTRVEGTGATLWTVSGMAAFLAAATAIAATVLLLEWLAERRRTDPVSIGALTLRGAVAVAALAALLGASYYTSNTLRWHLLRHNKMLGTLAYHLFADNVADIEEADWAAHRRGAPLGQADWVYDLYAGGADPTLAAAGPDAAVGTGAAPRPDLVFVMLDTLRADALAAYGGDPASMPRLNALAEGATVFSEVIANAPWTQPSVASFFTGLAPEEHGVVSIPYRMSAAALTLAEVLESQGYDTAAFVANGVIVGPDFGFSRGFEVFEYLVDAERAYARADTVTDTVLAWLTERRARRDSPTAGRAPLFLYVHYLDPHVPYESSASPRASGGFTIAEARRSYADELRFLDGELARLVDGLDAVLAGPRALFVTADHGEEFGEHDGLGHSQTLYSEVLDIPAVLKISSTPDAVDATTGAFGDAPGAEGGTAGAEGGTAAAVYAPPAAVAGDTIAVVDVALEGRDFFDLLLRLGAGESLDVGSWAAARRRVARVASLQFEKDPGRSELVHSVVRPYRDRIYNRMIQRGNWRYIWSAFGRTDELYDLSADPAERFNVARWQPELVASMRAELAETPSHWVQLVPRSLSEEALERLRQLGYIR